MKKILIILAILAALAAVGGGVYYYWRNQQAAQPIVAEREAQIEYGNVVSMVTATGRIRPERELELVFAGVGQVAAIYVDEGDYVQAGDLLAELDATELRIALDDAEASLRLAEISLDELQAEPSEAALSSAQAAVRQAQAQLALASQGPTETDLRIAELQVEIAKRNLWAASAARDQMLEVQTIELPGGDTQQVSTMDASNPEIQAQQNYLDSLGVAVEVAEEQMAQLYNFSNPVGVASARAALAQAQANLQRLQAGPTELAVEVAERQVEAARLAVALAQANLDNIQLIAPIGGVITQMNLVVGGLAPLALPAMILTDDSRLHLEADIDEIDIGQIAEEQPVFIEVDAFPDEEITGAITRIAALANETAGVVSYTIYVDLDEVDLPLRVGMTAGVSVVVEELEDALVVPNWALQTDPDTRELFVLVRRSETEIERVPIELGLRGEDYSQVLSGPEEGQTVVVLPPETPASMFESGAVERSPHDRQQR